MKQQGTEWQVNAFGQPIGLSLPDWQGAVRPVLVELRGRTCRVVNLDPPRHGPQLFEGHRRDASGANWTYLSVGPFGDDRELFEAWLAQAAASTDPLHLAIEVGEGREASGTASYMRIDPANGVIEVGFIASTPRLQRTTPFTEAMYLMMQHAFETLGYRRYEWKCDALNAPSRRAAERLGFTYEGTFRQAAVTRGRTRDTAWYSIIDRDWPELRAAFEAWLDPANFDADGCQRRKLEEIRASAA